MDLRWMRRLILPSGSPAPTRRREGRGLDPDSIREEAPDTRHRDNPSSEYKSDRECTGKVAK